MMHQEEGFLLIPTLSEPIKSQVGDCIRRVLTFEFDRVFAPGLRASNSKHGIKISSLPCKHAIKVEICRFDLQVPLPNHCSVVASLSHLYRQHLLSWHNLAAEVESPIHMVVLAGKHTGP